MTGGTHSEAFSIRRVNECDVCLGGNDIDTTVSMDLFQLASKLKNNIDGLRRVGFCQVVERKRWRHLSVEG